MPSPFTIIQGKEGASPKKPLFLVTITAPDGDVCYLTTAAYYGAPNISYSGNTYLARIVNNDIQAVQAMSPQGYDAVPGFSMQLADGDAFLWTNHCYPHGWRGASVVLTVILWDVVANAYSTDAYQITFIGGNPQCNDAQGTISIDVTSATNFTRLKVPSVGIEYRCPWDFPTTAAQRFSALNDPTSPYYQCGYSPDQPGGIGNYQSGTTPFTTCDYTRSSPTDPSIGCMARHGSPTGTASRPGFDRNGTAITVPASSTVAPDGDLSHDIAGHYTARFGGVTLVMPSAYSGHQYVTGQKLFGFNQPNTALANAYYNWVVGTQWVQGQVLAPAGDPNSLRSEVAVCFAPFGTANIIQLLVNGVLVTLDNSDVLFTWRYINPGGRSGALNGDKYYSTSSYSALGDPHGSVCVIEFVVPFELASPGSVPTVQALVTSGPLLNCYPIATAAGSGGEITITLPSTIPDLNIGPGSQCFIAGNSWSAANGPCVIDTAVYGPPGVVTLLGTAATGSGTGGGIFFYHPPDLSDTGYSISTQDSVGNGAAANAVWALLYLMSWGNISSSQINPVSWYASAQIAATGINYTGADGGSYTHAQFKACLQLPGGQRQPLASVLTGLKNSANLMTGQNLVTGLIDCYVKQTLADQQPAAILGSNDTTARASVTAAGASANGYYAYLFNETNIEKDSFKITTTRIESTPNTVAFAFQDEYNSYQQDSITEIDPNAYAYSGNQEVPVPISINAIPNFDQGTRIANTQLAEALYGNPRNDPGGTLYFEFSVNQRVIHLASRLGFICGLTWQPRGIGVSAPQPVRVLSLKPDTDGEHWQVKCAWHQDDWYTYAYGQNPAPFQTNPLLNPPARPPYPYRPGVAVWGSSDALFPNLDSFAFGVDTTQYPATLNISGAVPSNAQPSGLAPSVPLQASVATTGGSLAPGTYHIAFSADGTDGPVSSFITAVVPTGTSTNTITVSGIQWKSGAAPSILPFIGRHSMGMHACAGSSYTGSSPDSNGNPTTYVFTAYTLDGLGLPDINFSEFLVQESGIVHGGVWGDEITSVVGSVLTFAAAAWSSNQWAGYILSLYYRPGVTTQPGLNIAVSSSTAHTLTMAASGFLAGDIVVMRPTSGSITSNTIGDANFVNSYAPTGLVVNGEKGNLIQIIAGTGAWYPAKTIASNTATVFTINGTWDVTPDATSVFIILAPGIPYSITTNTFTGGSAGAAAIASTQAVTSQAQSLLVQVATADSGGNTSPMRYQPWREIYVPLQGAVTGVRGTRTMNASGNILASDSTVLFDTSGITGTTDTLAAAITVTTSPLTITLTSGTATVTGTYIQINSEILYIESGGGTTTPTVLRGQLGTAAATHINGSTVNVPGALAATLPAIATVLNQNFTLTKITTDLNYVKILPNGSPDLLPVSAPYIILADTTPALGTIGLLAPGTGSLWIQTSGAGLVGPAGPAGPSGSTGTPAPNVTSATGIPAYYLVGNLSAFGFSGVITLPTSDPNYSVLVAGAIQVMAFAPGDTKGTQIAWIPGSMFSGSTIAYSGGQFTQPTTGQTWSIQFVAYNSSGSPTASPISVTGISVQASAVTSVSAAFSSANNTVDIVTRQVHAHPTFIPTMTGGIVPQVVAFWLSEDGGATYGFYGNVRITTVGQSFAADTIAPSTAQTWMFGCLAGWYSYSSSVPIPVGSLPAGVVFSSGISMPAITLPSATDLTTLTIATGAGGSFPYNALRPDGSQYWDIPSVSWSDAFADINAWVVAVTCTDMDSTHTAIGPEHIFGFIQKSTNGATQTLGPLLGDYLTNGGSYVRTGNIAYVRFKVYVQNRVDQTSNGWSNSLASTLQTGIGSGAGYIDVLVASGGAQPTGQIPATRLSQVGSGLTQTSTSLTLGTGNVANSLMNPGFDDQNPLTGTAAHWTMVPNGGTASVISSPGVALSGNYMLALHGGSPAYAQSDPIAVVYNQTYYIQAWVLSDSGANGTGALYVAWEDHTGAYVSSTAVFSGVPAPGPGAWVSRGGLVTVPAGVSYMALQPQTNGNTSLNWYFDSLYVAPQTPGGAGTVPNSNGGLDVRIAGPLYVDISNDLNLSLASDFVVTGGVLNQQTVNLAKAVGFDVSAFSGGGGSNLGMNATWITAQSIAVNQLIAGSALFAGDAIFARSGAGKVTIGTAGIILQNAITSPTAAVTIASSGVNVAGGTSGVTIQNTITSPTTLVSLTASTVSISHGSANFFAMIAAGQSTSIGSVTGMLVQNFASTAFTAIVSGGIDVFTNTGNAGPWISMVTSGITVSNGSPNLAVLYNSIVINGTQVLSTRVVSTPATLADVIAVLQHHGLSN
jgi:hypothetical protein